MHKTALMLAAAAGVLTLMTANPVRANEHDRLEQTAEQSQTLKVECNSGAYGQDTNCKAEGTQSQKLRQIAYTRVLGAAQDKVHLPVNTALDSTAMLAVLATGLTGVGAFAGYLKLRA